MVFGVLFIELSLCRGVLIRGLPLQILDTHTCTCVIECKDHISGVFFQLLDLSSKLENLEEDQKSSHEVRERLRKEKEVMQERLVVNLWLQ